MNKPHPDFYHIAETGFQAARRLESLNSGFDEHRLHGHGFRLRLESHQACRLEDVRQELDYRYLNDILPNSDDLSLIQWLANRVSAPPEAQLDLVSAPEKGVQITADGPLVWAHFRFEAAHRLPNVPAGHQCGRMHGHGFEVRIHTRPEQQSAVEARVGINAAWAPLFARLDHQCLNQIDGLENPTSEMLAGWLWPRIKQNLPGLALITVQETHTAGCRYDGQQYRIWKDQRFESALQLPDVADDDPRIRLHGHSYLLRLELTAPLDEVLGWTVDFGDVKTLFKPIYKQLDHHQLNELAGVEDGDIKSLLHWVHGQAAPQLAELTGIELMETPDCGARISWG